MKKITCALFVILAVALLMNPATQAAGAEDDGYEIEFTGTVTDELDSIDVDLLSDSVSGLVEKYTFSDDDIDELTDATMDFISTVNAYAKSLKTAEEGKVIPAPHDELKAICDKLELFLKKYNVTVEDTLEVGRSLAFVAMSVKEEKAALQPSTGDDPKKFVASREDVDAVFMRLKEFAKSHKMMASDFIPVIYRLCDIGLTLMQNKVDLKKLKDSGGRWRKRLYDLGVSKEQADALYDTLLAFVYKYKISLREIMKLNKDINKLLKRKAETK